MHELAPLAECNTIIGQAASMHDITGCTSWHKIFQGRHCSCCQHGLDKLVWHLAGVASPFTTCICLKHKFIRLAWSGHWHKTLRTMPCYGIAGNKGQAAGTEGRLAQSVEDNPRMLCGLLKQPDTVGTLALNLSANAQFCILLSG